MRSLLSIIIIAKALYNLRFELIDHENFFYFKCIFYLFVSSIHSIFLSIPVPLGGLIMFCLLLIDSKNFKVKLKMIGGGLLIMILSLFNFHGLVAPFQSSYLFLKTQSISQIDFYSYNTTHDNFLFSINVSDDILNWVDKIRLSEPAPTWGHKKTDANLGYKLILHTANEILPIYISPYDETDANLFIGDYKLPYTNDSIIPYFHSIYSNKPSSLTINSSKQSAINIYTQSILDNLWRVILWGESAATSLTDEDFIIPSYLFFDQYLGCKLSFTLDFKYARLDGKRIIEMPSYLQTMLNEQYILSQLDYVNELSLFEPVHTSSDINTMLNFSIELDANGMYYGLYLQDYKKDETTLLHTVTSPNASFFVLRHPYILLLDEKSPSSYYLMLVNQNIPSKHRYIVKNEPVVPRSISLCPQNTQFSYIVDHGDTSTLYLVSDYYRSPKVVATGQVTDSLFLSNDYLVFTQIIDEQSLLCIYSLTHNQLIKYINVPGDIILTDAKNEILTFAVQAIEGLNLKEGLFCIDNNLDIYKKKRP